MSNKTTIAGIFNVIGKREEPQETWEFHKVLNQQIKDHFQASVKDFDWSEAEYNAHVGGATFTKKASRGIIDDVRNLSLDPATYAPEEYERTPDASLTVASKGSGILCFVQNFLRFTTLHIPGAEYREEIVKCLVLHGYVHPERGTYHNIFDHHGCRRATTCKEVLDAIEYGHGVTLLVDNCPLMKRQFVNIIETDIDPADDRYIAKLDLTLQGEVTEVDARELLKAAEIAWIW